MSPCSGRVFAEISIHAPHARSDTLPYISAISALISIHAPHARSDTLTLVLPSGFLTFQSTLLMRGATPAQVSSRACHPISIHAPHARSDYPAAHVWKAGKSISIHAPHARSDMMRRLVM